MRAKASEFDNAAPADSLLAVLDQFAALRSYSAAAPAVGGYRLLAPQREAAFAAPRKAATTATVAALASTRQHLTGFLSVLFVGALGLAVLAGPASCPSCGDDAAKLAERSPLSRLGYAENARFASTHDAAKDESELPLLATTTLVEPEASTPGVSPITTSALDPSRDVAPVKPDQPLAARAGRLPAAAIAALADAGPTVKVAAVSLDGDMLATLPTIEVTTPKAHVTAKDVEAAAADDKPAPHKKRVTRAYRAPPGKAAGHAPGTRDALIVQRAPRWAQQMYVTPWQSQAFSYTR